jgi:hypothetical protein
MALRYSKIFVLTFTFTILALLILSGKPQNDEIIMRWRPPTEDVIEMPVLRDSNPSMGFQQYAPEEQRGIEYRQYLAASVKIRVSGASGSGTITYYDPSTRTAYVTSCGHLWSGTRSADEVNRNPVSAKIITWYHNDVKLQEPRTYDAQVLFWSNDRGYDSSLLKFTPDWEPDYFPIAGLDYPIIPGLRLHSLGCDGGREVAHYDVEVVEQRGVDLVTRRNSPRPGRSGGGLMSSDGYYVGTCWGTSDTTSGGGVGYFTPLSAIHKVYARNGYGFLLNMPRSGMARKLPIRDWDQPGREWDEKEIPLPRGIGIPLPIR